MSIDIPNPIGVAIEGPIGPVTVDGIDIPDTFFINIDKLPRIAIDPITINPLSVGITQLPKVSIGLDPLTVNPVELSVGLTRIPDIRAHIPADFSLGFKMLGLELFSVSLAGEAQVITEPYIAQPCEVVDQPPPRPLLTALPPLPHTQSPAPGSAAPAPAPPVATPVTPNEH